MKTTKHGATSTEVHVNLIVEGDIVTYRNGVQAPVLRTRYDEDHSPQHSVTTAACGGQYDYNGHHGLHSEDDPDEWDIVAVDSSKRPLTIYEWAAKNTTDANLLCCGLGKVVRA